jgi:hypothetical protein
LTIKDPNVNPECDVIDILSEFKEAGIIATKSLSSKTNIDLSINLSEW